MVEVLDGAGFALLAAGEPPRAGLRLSDPRVAPPEVLEMLARIADGLRERVDPNAWVVVEDDAIVSLCSITNLAQPGVPVIGYGTAPAHEAGGRPAPRSLP